MSNTEVITYVVATLLLNAVIFVAGFRAGGAQAERNHMHRGFQQRPKTANQMTGFIVWCTDTKRYAIVADDGSRLPLDGQRFAVEQFPWLAKWLLDEYGPYAQAGMGFVRVPDWRTGGRDSL